MIHPIDLNRISRAMGDPDAILPEPANDDGSFDSCSLEGKARAVIAITLGVWAVLGMIGALAFYLTR